MSMLGALETGSSIGRLLAEGFLYSDDPLFINRELEWLNAATEDELREVAARWLTRGYYQLTVEPFPELVSADSDVDRSSIPAVTASPAINFPDFEIATLKNGMKLVVATRRSIPLIDLSIQIDTGSVAAPQDAPGLVSFLFALMDKGTKKYDASELAAAKDRIGMSGQFRDGLERSSYSYRILRPYLVPSLELAADMLRTPTFPDEELTKYKARVAAYLANLEKAPSRAARSLFDRAVYGADTPMGAVWTPELLEQVDRDRLEVFHRAEITPDRMTIFMIGDIGIEDASAAVRKVFGSWNAGSSTEKKAVGAAEERRARVILIDHPGAESSTIIAGHAIPPYDAETSTELSIMNHVLGGSFESRLNMKLREEKGWSYGYNSRISTNASGDMTIVMSGQVQTDKTAPSMREILTEIGGFVAARPATEDEVERARRNRIRSLPGTFATNRGFLSSMIRSDTFGLPLDYAESAAARLEAVTTSGVTKRASNLIDPDRLTWVISGDLEKIEENVRALNYGDVEVWDPFGNKLR
jgi:predicted Zn-dependent peptidase